jgi:hypothetical protein
MDVYHRVTSVVSLIHVRPALPECQLDAALAGNVQRRALSMSAPPDALTS